LRSGAHASPAGRCAAIEIQAVIPVEPFDHGDPRYRAHGFIDGVAHCLVFTIRDEQYRLISLRRAHEGSEAPRPGRLKQLVSDKETPNGLGSILRRRPGFLLASG
jgi:hypothetical protein